MKRHLLIAALATMAAGTVAAQSSVTVYGRLNTSVEQHKISGGDAVIKLWNNASRLGFRGVEDLGGGLKAGFVLEHRFDVDTGNATNGVGFWGGAGTSEVFLGNALATLRLGHFTSEAYFATSDWTDLLNHGTGTSSDALYKYLGNDNNKVALRSSALGPVEVHAAVSLGEGTTPRVLDLAAYYAGGPLTAGFGYEKVDKGDSQVAIRGAYEFGPALVTGYVQNYKNQAADASKTIVRVSGMYTMGMTELHAAFGTAGELESNGFVIEPKAKQFTLGANYNLSKRTKVFAFFNKTDVSGGDAGDVQAISAGVRHNF